MCDYFYNPEEYHPTHNKYEQYCNRRRKQLTKVCDFCCNYKRVNCQLVKLTENDRPTRVCHKCIHYFCLPPQHMWMIDEMKRVQHERRVQALYVNAPLPQEIKDLIAKEMDNIKNNEPLLLND